MSDEMVQLLRDRSDREYNLLNERTNIFLLTHTILMAGAAIGNISIYGTITLGSLGGFISLIWIYISHRTLKMADYYNGLIERNESSMPEEKRLFSNSFKYRTCVSRPIFNCRVSNYLAYVLPSAWMLVWIVFIFIKVLDC